MRSIKKAAHSLVERLRLPLAEINVSIWHVGGKSVIYVSASDRCRYLLKKLPREIDGYDVRTKPHEKAFLLGRSQ